MLRIVVETNPCRPPFDSNLGEFMRMLLEFFFLFFFSFNRRNGRIGKRLEMFSPGMSAYDPRG